MFNTSQQPQDTLFILLSLFSFSESQPLGYYTHSKISLESFVSQCYA